MIEKFDKQNNPKQSNLNLFMQCVSFFAVGLIALALIFGICFKGNVTLFSIFSGIAQALAYSVCIILAGFWVKGQKHIAWTICYVIFVVVIVVMFIMTFVNF